MTARLAHWLGVLAALVPIPFAVQDFIGLELSQAEWYWQAFAVAFTLALSLIAYVLVRGAVRLAGRLVGSK